MSDNKNIFGVLVGMAVGAGIGVLFAPDKGSKTRQKIADGAVSAKDTIVTEATHIKDEVTTKAETLKNNVSDTLNAKSNTLEEKLDTIITDACYKAEDVISNLELRLKTLKAKNKKLQTK